MFVFGPNVSHNTCRSRTEYWHRMEWSHAKTGVSGVRYHNDSHSAHVLVAGPCSSMNPASARTPFVRRCQRMHSPILGVRCDAAHGARKRDVCVSTGVSHTYNGNGWSNMQQMSAFAVSFLQRDNLD